jgi:hypothetical protein
VVGGNNSDTDGKVLLLMFRLFNVGGAANFRRQGEVEAEAEHEVELELELEVV